MIENAAHTPTASILLIGNELLSGKIRDENGFFLAQMLRRRGIELLEISTVQDSIEAIRNGLLRMVNEVEPDLIFSTGGLGPTHDDVTLEAISNALQLPLERNPTMEQMLRQFSRSPMPKEALNMANLPRGTQLLALPGWPVLRIDHRSSRIYILPGVPSLLQRKIAKLEDLPRELPQASPWCLRELIVHTDESQLTSRLNQVVAEFPHVDIGSYPIWFENPQGKVQISVKLTFESRDATDATAAQQRLHSLLSPEELLSETIHAEKSSS